MYLQKQKVACIISFITLSLPWPRRLYIALHQPIPYPENPKTPVVLFMSCVAS